MTHEQLPWPNIGSLATHYKVKENLYVGDVIIPEGENIILKQSENFGVISRPNAPAGERRLIQI